MQLIFYDQRLGLGFAKTLFLTRWYNFAENFFQIAAVAASKSTGATKINDKPYSRSVTENQNSSEISFSIKFDDDPVAPGTAKCIYKVDLSENLIKNIVDIKS